MKTAPEIIAFALGQDYADMKNCRYQPTRTEGTAVYVIGDDYYCCPTTKQKPPNGFDWHPFRIEYGRMIYQATPESFKGE